MAFKFTGGLAGMTDEEKKKRQAALLLQQADQTRKSRQIVDGKDPLLAEVKIPLSTRLGNAADAAKRIGGTAGLGVIKGAAQVGATGSDIFMSPKDAVMHAVKPEVYKSAGWRSRQFEEDFNPVQQAAAKKLGLKGTSAENITQEIAGFLPALALSGGMTRAVGLAPKVETAAAAAAKKLGGTNKFAGDAASAIIKNSPDMLNTWLLKEAPQNKEDRTPLPLWAAEWAAGDVAFKGAGALGRKALGKIGKRAGEALNVINDVPEDPGGFDVFDSAPVNKVEHKGLTQWRQDAQQTARQAERANHPAYSRLNPYLSNENLGKTPIQLKGPARASTLTPEQLAANRAKLQQPVLSRNVDRSKLPNKYPLPPSADEIIAKALVQRAKNQQLSLPSGAKLLALPEPKNPNWEFGTGIVDPDYKIKALAGIQKEGLNKTLAENVGKLTPEQEIRSLAKQQKSIVEKILEAEKQAQANIKARNAAYADPQALHAKARDPLEDLRDLTIVAAGKVVRAGITFKQFSQEMIEQYGKGIEPHLANLWHRGTELAKTGKTVLKYQGREITVNLSDDAGKAAVSSSPSSAEYDMLSPTDSMSGGREMNSPEFKAWFKGSKVVDEKGTPKKINGVYVKHNKNLPTDIDKDYPVFKALYEYGYEIGEKADKYTSLEDYLDYNNLPPLLEGILINGKGDTADIVAAMPALKAGFRDGEFRGKVPKYDSVQVVVGDRIGKVPDSFRSRNFRDNYSENGVSILGYFENGEYVTNNQNFRMFNSGEEHYVFGIKLETFLESGADGEPLLLYPIDLGKKADQVKVIRDFPPDPPKNMKADKVTEQNPMNKRLPREASLLVTNKPDMRYAVPGGQKESAQGLADRILSASDDAMKRIQERNVAYSNPQALHAVARNPLEDFRDMTIIAAGKVVRAGITFKQFSEEMIQQFGQSVEPHLANLWHRGTELAKTGKTVLKYQGREITVNLSDDAGKAAVSSSPSLPGGKAKADTPGKQIAAIKKHIENTKNAAKYNGDESARAARIAELEAQLAAVQKGNTALAGMAGNVKTAADKEQKKIIADFNQRLNKIYDQIDEVGASNKLTAAEKADRIATLNEQIKAIQSEPLYSKEALDAHLAQMKEELGAQANWKDKGAFSLARETMIRNFEDVMGADAPAMIEKYLNPVATKETARIRFLNQERAGLKAFGIKAHSKDSTLVQKYGEGLISEADLRAQRPKQADNIIATAKYIRQRYDDFLDQLNAALDRNGYDPIPKRKDYMRHFQDVGAFIEQFGFPLHIDDLPTDINGLTHQFRPGKNFFASALARRGEKTAYDAITGFDKYIDGASKVIFHTDNIQALRQLEKNVRRANAGTTHLSNFASALTEYINHLAGKNSLIDRSAEMVVGRKAFAAANWVRKKTGANMIGGNVSTALTNFIPVTLSLATNSKTAAVKAAAQTIKNVAVNDGFVQKSDFLTRRIGSDPLAMRFWDKAATKAGWLFKTVDNMVSQFVVRSKYNEGIKKGLSETAAMKAADDWAARLMADRSLGGTPIIFDSKMLGFFTQFQTEVNNQISFIMKDIPRNTSKVGLASAVAQIALYSYVFNNIFESLAGYRPALDPIGLGKQAYDDYKNPKLSDSKATQNLVENIGNQLPFTSIFTGGRIPVGAAIPNPMAVLREESSVGKELMKPVTYVLPPFGGGQARKTISGINALKNKGVYSKSDRLLYPVDTAQENELKTLVFGANATKAARRYWENDENPLGDKQTAAYKEAIAAGKSPSAFYEMVLKTREIEDQIEDIEKNPALTDAQKKAKKKPLQKQVDKLEDATKPKKKD